MDNFLPLLQSLFCKQGLDNRRRFGSIILAVHLLFTLFWLIFSQNLFFLSLVALVFAGIVFLSSKRRLLDAELSNYWTFIPCALFAISAIFLINLNSSWSLIAFIPSLFSAGYLFSLPTRKHQRYTYGYAGPVDLTASINKSVHIRTKIEPSLDGSVDTLQLAEEPQRPNSNVVHTPPIDSINIHQWITDNVLSIKHIKFIAPLSLALLVLVISAISSRNDSSIEQSEAELTEAPVDYSTPASSSSAALLNIVSMPDDFELASSEFDGIALKWQADTVGDKTLWDIATTNGDKSCTHLTFNQGSKYRAITVNVVNGDTYVASFSPLDTAEIIKDLAYRNTFTLCGYDFSLKGSQAVIGKHNFYAKWL